MTKNYENENNKNYSKDKTTGRNSMNSQNSGKNSSRNSSRNSSTDKTSSAYNEEQRY